MSISHISCWHIVLLYNESTGCTSAKVIFGKYLRLPVDLLLALGPTRGRGLELSSNDTGDLCEILKRVHHYARNHLKLAFNSTTHKGRMALAPSSQVLGNHGAFVSAVHVDLGERYNRVLQELHSPELYLVAWDGHCH